ncbi:MAG TPA: hypothetical protein VK435_00575 [Thermodesulfovibrionales bacterium]|nr:hypothetical protein [Thermodesulfovibrionales bacterium]
MTAENRADNWLLQSKEEHRELFSELDVLLRALERFFHVENLPIPDGELPDRNFVDELQAVRDVIFRILAILEVVIPESRKNAYWFQKFSESKLLSDHTRDLFVGKLYTQDTPEKAFYLLYDLFINLKGIITDLLKTGEISYLSYTNIGQLISKQIRENVQLNPFRKDLNPDFDSIDNAHISRVVKSIPERDIRKNISFLYLYLFRFLRFLRHIDIDSQNSISLNSSLLILIMLRSEISSFHAFIKRICTLIRNRNLQNLLKSISYQFSMETKRVYIQELKNIIRRKAPHHFRGKLENSQGILKNLVEQSIVQLTQFFDPEIQGKDIFESFTTRFSQSVQLREDLFVLHRFCTLLEEKAAFPEVRNDVLKSMRDYMHHFEHSAFQLLRYDDFDEFAYFFEDIFSFQESEMHKLLERTRSFKIFLETTLRSIANRSELKDEPVNIDRVEETVRQYL